MVNHEEMGLLRKIHRNLGHPSAGSLQKILRQAGAPAKFIKAAGDLQCDICIKQAQRKPVLPASTNAPQVKWETISVDTFYWQNPCNDDEGNERHLLAISYFDESTDLHVAGIVREGNQLQGSLRAEEFKTKFLDDWLKCLPKPKMIRFDTEGCFRSGQLKQWLEEQMIQVVPIAGEAYWQVGRHSRRLHTLKQQMTKLANDLGNQVDNKEILSLCLSAKNEVHQIKGYSPNQWAFGQNSDRVFSTLNCYQHLPNMSSQDPSFHENIARMARARELFIRVDSHRKLERAALLKSRKQQSFDVGDLVYYFRKGRGKGCKQRGQWHGPARVLFCERTTKEPRGYPGSVIWISHGLVLLRCAPEHLQHVSRDVKMIDDEINGPFSPDEFLKGKHVYQDLFGERDTIEEVATGDDDTAWTRDPNDMEIRKNDSMETHEPGPEFRPRLYGKQAVPSDTLDRVVGRPSHAEPSGSNQEAQPEEGRPRDEELPDDEPAATRTVDSPSRLDTRGEDLRRAVGERRRILPMGSGSHARQRGMETTPSLPTPPSSSRRARSSGDGQERQEEEQGSSSSAYRPIRREQHVERRDWLGCGGQRQSTVQSEHREHDEPDGPGDEQSQRTPGTTRDQPAEHDIRGHGTEPNSTMKDTGDDPHKRALSGSREPGQGAEKKTRVHFCEPVEMCEIVLNIGPKDVHYKRKGSSGSWMVNQKVKRGAEVNFRELNQEEQEQFKQAKSREIDSYMERTAVEIASSVGVDEERIMGMRWILVWKNEVNDEGEVVGKKPKARLIIKGFQDPDLLKIERDAPTLSTIGRNLIFAITSKRRWRLALGDIKTAFLNGDDTEYDRMIFGEPPPDVKDYLGMSQKELFRIRKAIYGLLNAPRKWVEKLWKELRNDGWVQSVLEPCVWRLFDGDSLVGILGIHVDDIITGGDGTLYQQKIKQLREVFPFGSWKDVGSEKVVFCGCELSQHRDGSIYLGQEQYALGLNEIPLERERTRREFQCN